MRKTTADQPRHVPREYDRHPREVENCIEVKSPGVAHEVMMNKVREWLNGACKSPSDKVTKDRLKGLLAS